MEDITTIILTKNEEKNIRDCINSIKDFSSRIIVIDSFSDDKTTEIANDLGVEVIKKKFVNYSQQFNWGIDNCNITTKWTLRLDADERLPEKLKSELSNILKSSKSEGFTGITLNSNLIFLGKSLKFGASNKRKIMLFRTGIGRIENRNMDEHTILSEGFSIQAKNSYLHYDFKDIDTFIKKINSYSSREVIDYFDFRNGKPSEPLKDKKLSSTRFFKFNFYYKFPMFIRSNLLFIYFFYFKLGFLDGVEGFIYTYLMTKFYRLLCDIKIYEQLNLN